MDSIGHKLVKNSVIGAGAGAAVGLGVGIWKNHQAMEAVPTDTVTLNGYDKPVMGQVKVGTDTWEGYDGHTPYFGGLSQDVYANAPTGTEHVAEQTVTGRGKAIIGSKSIPIKEPVNISNNTVTEQCSYNHNGEENDYAGQCYNVGTHNYVTYDMQTTGYYQQPTVRFETGVNSAGIILSNVAMFAAIGGAVGAVTTVVADKIK